MLSVLKDMYTTHDIIFARIRYDSCFKGSCFYQFQISLGPRVGSVGLSWVLDSKHEPLTTIPITYTKIYHACMHAWMYGCMDVRMSGCMDLRMHGCMDVRMYVFTI